MTKKVYIDGFVFCHRISTEGTYHRRFGKCARFPIFRLKAEALSSFRTKRFKCSYLKTYTLLNLIFGKNLNHGKNL